MAIDVQHGGAGEARISKTAILTALAVVGWMLAAYFLWSGLSDRAAVERLQAAETENRRLTQEANARQQTAASFAESEQQAAAAKTSFDRLTADRTEVAQQLYETRADLQLARETLARVTAEIDERQPRLAQLQADSVQVEHELAAARTGLESLRAEAGKRSQELAEAEQHRDAARQDEAAARRNVAALARDLEERRAEFAWFEAHGQEARDSYAEAQRQLEGVQQKLGEAERASQGGASAVAAAAASEGTSMPVAAAMTPPPRDEGAIRDCEACPELVAVAAGGFEMGARNLSPAERPVHHVDLARPFAIGRYEVSFAEWDACVADGGCNGFRPDDHGWGRGDRPVVGVSWDDAIAFAGWLSKKTGQHYRLPTEAEWEYAAHGGSRPLKNVAAGAAATAYWWGDAPGRGRANCAGCGSPFDGKQTAPVGSFEPNPLGLYNMHGNAAEWVADCWSASYAGAPTDGGAVDRPQCGERVLRGGAFNQDPSYATAASRFKYDATVRYYAHGFRVARDMR